MAKQSSFPQQSIVSLRNRSQGRARRRNASNRTSNHSASRSDFQSQLNSEARSCHKPRRRKLPLDLSRFFSDPGNQSDTSNLCDRCRCINFEAIFNVPGQEIGLQGTPVFELGSLVPEQRLADCSLCALFASTAFGPLGQKVWTSPVPDHGSDSWHLRLYSALQMLRLKHTKSRQRFCRSKVLSVVHASAEYAHSRGKTWLSKTCEASLSREVIVPINSTARTTMWKSQQEQHRESSMAIALDCLFDYQGRLLQKDNIRYDILQRWIDQCDQHHSYCSSSVAISKVDPPAAKWLIDCKSCKECKECNRGKKDNNCEHDEYEIVLSKAGMEYFALSYVWGRHCDNENMKPKELGSRKILPANLPASVADAMTVVKALGYRYLWVDRFCINQHSGSAEKIEQVGRMDDIFEHAVATIIATGSNADSGLPGVSSRARYPQPVAKVSNITLISSSPNQSPILEFTKWRHRGWTFQEYLLSRRCLIFTNAQVYFTCRQSWEAEAIRKSPEVDKIRKPRRSDTFLGPELFEICSRKIGRFAAASWPLLDLQLQEYTGRELTYSSDALNAFRGILKRSNEKTYWGVPIFSGAPYGSNSWPCALRLDDICFGFTHGLLWAPLGQIRHRNGTVQKMPSGGSPDVEKASVRETSVEQMSVEFPSWSWTSSREAVAFLTARKARKYLIYLPKEDTSASPVFSVEDHKGNIRTLQDVVKLCEEYIVPEQTRYLHLQCNIATCMILCDDNNVPCGIHEIGLLSPTSDLYVPTYTVDGGKRPLLTFDAFLDDEVFQNEARGRTRDEPWDLIFLMEDWWMLIYWKGNTAYRAGIIRTSCSWSYSRSESSSSGKSWSRPPDRPRFSLKQKNIRLG